MGYSKPKKSIIYQDNDKCRLFHNHLGTDIDHKYLIYLYGINRDAKKYYLFIFFNCLLFRSSYQWDKNINGLNDF